jgi:hypothetical protein
MAKSLTSTAKTMTFLWKRACLIVVTAEGKHSTGTYLPNDNVTILGRGTGVLLENEGRVFVATNDHVIQARRAEIGSAVHIALENGKPFAEFHDGYAYAAREFQDDGTGNAALDAEGHPIPKDPVNDTDLALVRLTPNSAEAARRNGRKFVDWSKVPKAPPINNPSVCFRGYPKKNVDFVKQLRRFDVDGFSLFSSILRTEGKRLVVDATEKAVCYGHGRVDPQRDLHGISGSGLFDMTGKLIGIVYGGDSGAKEIFACAASELGPLFEKLK